MDVSVQAELRKLPGVDALLRDPLIQALAQQYGHVFMAELARALLEEQRAVIRKGSQAPQPAAWPARLRAAAAQRAAPSLLPVINATGIILHTNLGRAPLSEAARRAVAAVSVAYTNLEYDLDTGRRGSRHDHARVRLCRVTGAEDALIVNNNAAALFLVLAGLCQDQEVIISRGQLVEIGGGFRIPDVMQQSGARLVEVGTTNRTRAQDFAHALTPATGALLRVHSSNFKQVGFVAEPTLSQLADVAHTARAARPEAGGNGSAPLLIDDLGSGTLLPTEAYGLAPEPTVQGSVAAGVDVITFSGDKLLGGPQAGLIVGRADPIARLRRHPLARALRVDKMTLAALDATLAAYEAGRAPQDIPVWRMMAASPADLRRRAEGWRTALINRHNGRHPHAGHLMDAQALYQVVETESAVGGGSLPGETQPSVGLALNAAGPHLLAARLRKQQPPLIGRIHDGKLLLDARTVLPEQDEQVVELVFAAMQSEEQSTGTNG